MRNEGIQIDQALNELFRVTREADIPAEVSHLKVSGRDSWGQMRRVIARIDSARASGLDVTADQYPYIRAATALDASIPTWAESGGMDSLLARLRDPRTRARLRQEDRKSTRLNSSHPSISYAVFCLKKKKSRNCRLRE